VEWFDRQLRFVTTCQQMLCAAPAFPDRMHTGSPDFARGRLRNHAMIGKSHPRRRALASQNAKRTISAT
jgi:hypothetical protein